MPDIALGNNQQGRYLLIVNDKNVVEQRQVQPGELIDGGMRIINSGLLPNERVVVGGIMRALPGNTVVPVTTTAAAAAAGTDPNDRQVLYRAAGSRQRHRAADRHPRHRRALQSSRLAISRRRAAHRAGDGALSRRQRRHRRPRGGAADRAAGQRRRGHDLHVVAVDQRRPVHAHRHLQDRHRRRQGADPRREPRVERARLAARERAEAGPADDQEDRPRFSRSSPSPRPTGATTACSCRTTPPSTCSTRSPASTASAASPCSAPANTPSASGSIRRSCRRAGSSRRT